MVYETTRMGDGRANLTMRLISEPNPDGGAVLKDERGGYIGVIQYGHNGHEIAARWNVARVLLTALERIAREGGYEPTEEELEGEDKGHYLQILGRWDAGEIARTAITAALGEARP